MYPIFIIQLPLQRVTSVDILTNYLGTRAVLLSDPLVVMLLTNSVTILDAKFNTSIASNHKYLPRQIVGAFG